MKKYKIIIIILIFIISVSGIIYLKNAYTDFRPNILFINADALRADHLSCYGYKRNTSPNIDKLAKEGLMFTQAISQSSFTPSSIFSILTSVYPASHGVFNFGVTMNPDLVTLPEILKNRGYYLGLISGRGRLSEFHFPEVEKIFDIYYPPSNAEIIKADEVSRDAIKWLRANKKKKFFLWLYYLEPHTPYRPPPPYNKLFINNRVAKENNKYVPIDNESMNRFNGYKVIPKITAVKNITNINYYISQYDGEISFVDDQLGVVFAEMKRLNLYDNTIIIFTSDHGESMGEHDFYFVHGDNLYDELLKVPLIIRYKSIGENKVINTQVQSIDIMPTILDVIGIKMPKQIVGQSLLLLSKKGKYEDKYALSELVNGGSEMESIRTGNWKLIYSAKQDRYELYNLEDDPGELKNLANTDKIQTEFLRRELHNWMKKAQSKIATQKKVLDETSQRKLQSLGYVQ